MVRIEMTVGFNGRIPVKVDPSAGRFRIEARPQPKLGYL
jgi:hypothetical protein